ncbi:MAG: hypothetical protein EHM19_02375 [Candidatus Latescibacterota bacterium]|nr:MAG: hypothetical protein EHM19_02375 [Candidatus Latescibacterota bacterium]
MDGLSIALQRGGPLLLAAALALSFAAAVWSYRRTLPPLPPRTRRALTALRFASFAVLSLLLLDPLVTIERTETVRPNVAILVDRSASMGIVDRPTAGEEGQGAGVDTTRAMVAEALLAGGANGIEEKLGKRYDVVRERFAASLATSVDSGSADATDLARGLEGTIEKNWERGVDAILLLSDGIANAGRDPVRAAEEIGVPVFPVPIGDPTPRRDLAVEQVLANPLVYVKSRVNVEVTVSGKGFDGEEVPVYLKEGGVLVAESRVRFEGKRDTEVLSLAFNVSEPGVRRYTVEVPERKGEIVAEHNRVLFTVEVVKEKIEILVFAERPSWDLAFLRRTLERDPNVHARLFVQGRDGKPTAIASPPEGTFPYSEGDLARVDLVLLVGVPSVAEREWGSALQSYVQGRGGALLFFAEGPIPPLPAAIGEILPVVPEGRRGAYEQGSFAPRLTEEGKRHPMLRLGGIVPTVEEAWKEIPPLVGWNRIGPLRPGSSLLASHPEAEIGGREGAVIAFRATGKGRVLLVDGGGIWRWGFRERGDVETGTLYDRFWSNAVRWLVAREGFRNVTVKPDAMTYDRGEPVTFRGFVLDGALAPVADARVEVTLTGPGGDDRRFQVEPDPADPGAYARTLGPLPPGDYTYAAAALRGEAPLGEDSGEFTVSDFSAEFLETERNDALLAAVARASGGKVVPLEEVRGWEGDLGLASRAKTVRAEREIWNHIAFFLLLVALFSAEWTIRKRAGLS